MVRVEKFVLGKEKLSFEKFLHEKKLGSLGEERFVPLKEKSFLRAGKFLVRVERCVSE